MKTTRLLFTLTTLTLAAIASATQVAYADEPSATGEGAATQAVREGDDRRVLSAFAPGGGRLSVGGAVTTFVIIPLADVRLVLGLSDQVSFYGRGMTLGLASAGEGGIRVQVSEEKGTAIALDFVAGALTFDGDHGPENDLITFAKVSSIVSFEAGPATLSARMGLPMLLSKSDVDRPSKRFLLVEVGVGVEVPVFTGANFFAELTSWILFEPFEDVPAFPSLTLGLSI